MENKIYYEAEVRKVYPDAICQYKIQLKIWIVKDKYPPYKEYGTSIQSDKHAWRNAYEQLTKNK